jgi:hypothetical protein
MRKELVATVPLPLSSATKTVDVTVCCCADGLKGFATQGVLPEMMRATYMRVLKFFLFPITHKAMFGTPENKGSPMTKAAAAAVASLPEGFTIQPLEVAKIALQLVRPTLILRMRNTKLSARRCAWAVGVCAIVFPTHARKLRRTRPISTRTT